MPIDEEHCNHSGVILAHEEKFKNYDKQIETIFSLLKEASDVVNKHICSSIDRIMAIEKNKAEIAQINIEIGAIKDGHKEIRFWSMTILLAFLAHAWFINWKASSYVKQLEVNTLAISELNSLHPRLNIDLVGDKKIKR
jgi:hypothetical protein